MKLWLNVPMEAESFIKVTTNKGNHMYEDYHEPRTYSDSGGWAPGLFILLALLLTFIFWPSEDPPKAKVEVPEVNTSQERLKAFSEVSTSCLKNEGVKEMTLASNGINMDIKIICTDGMSKIIKNVPLN